MRRRELMLLLGGTMTAARGLRAQQKAMAFVGYLNGGSPPLSVGHGPVHQGLNEAGWVEGQNMAIEYRWAEDHYDRLPALAADLVSRKVDVIVAVAGTPEAIAAKSASSTIPIVFTGASDPVGAGLVASFSRPGRNLTGFSPMNIELMAKRFEMLTEVVPQVRVIALLVNPNNQTTEAVIRAVQEAARVKGVQLPILKASTEEEIDAAFATIAELRAGGLGRRLRFVPCCSARATRGAGIALCRSSDRSGSLIRGFWRPDQLWTQRPRFPSPSRRLRRKDSQG
jgi:putative ABC transport system substrate-binding protein